MYQFEKMPFIWSLLNILKPNFSTCDQAFSFEDTRGPNMARAALSRQAIDWPFAVM